MQLALAPTGIELEDRASHECENIGGVLQNLVAGAGERKKRL